VKGVANAYKVITTKAKDFDKAMPVVEVRVGRLGVKDLLLDGQSKINIILIEKEAQGFRRPQLAPFMVHMVNKHKV
jgi:hypothetical protein